MDLLSALVGDMQRLHPSSGERNFRLRDAPAAVAAVEAQFAKGAEIDRLDGLSVSYPDWRFSLRRSNTEPVVRLNVESRADPVALQMHTDAISGLLQSFS